MDFPRIITKEELEAPEKPYKDILDAFNLILPEIKRNMIKMKNTGAAKFGWNSYFAVGCDNESLKKAVEVANAQLKEFHVKLDTSECFDHGEIFLIGFELHTM